MAEMSIEERDRAEAQIKGRLKSVRLVFELGFPQDLVKLADDVVDSAGPMLMRGTSVRYQASFVLKVVNLAKDRRDRSFWSAELLRPLREQMRLQPQQLAETTRTTIAELRLETFDDLVENENALRNMTPVTMHSGIPVNNMDDLVYLIEVAARRHRYTAEEQIEYWSSSPNGFGGLWAAPRRLFQRGGAIALDLLDQVNEALRNPATPEVSGLPEHLVRAIGNATRGRHVFTAGARGRGAVGVDAYISLDPASTMGPVLQLPQVSETTMSRWRVTGSPVGDVPVSRESETTVRLSPAKDYEVSALSASGVVSASRIFRTYSGLPIVFFDSVTGRMLPQSGRRVETEGAGVVALVHPKVDLVGAVEGTRVECEGAWSGWTVRSLTLGDSRTVTAFDTVHTDETEDFLFVRGISRPALVHARRPRAALESQLGEVFVEVPRLRLDIAGADPALVTVVVESDDGAIQSSLADLVADGNVYDISPLCDRNGPYRVRVDGPIGLRMASQRLFLLTGLDAVQDPPLGIPSVPVTIEMFTDDWSGSFVVPPFAETTTAVVGGFEVRARAERIEWALSVGTNEPTVLGGREFTFTAAEAETDQEVFLHLRSNVPCEIDIDMMDGLSLVHTETVQLMNVRRSFTMATFLRHAAEEGSEVHVLVGRIQGSPPFTLGRITSEYIVSVEASVEDRGDARADVEVRFDENKPFGNRVIRMWSLDRPWEPSRSVAVPDDVRDRFVVQLPAGHRSGRYRLWMRIENQGGANPRLPKNGVRGVADINVVSGRGYDPDDPVDRILQAVSLHDTDALQPGDVEEHGHVLIALLSLGIADSGGAGLSGRAAAIVYRLLENDSDHIIRHVVAALDRDVVDEEWSTHISLALLPLLFEAEDRSDLSVEEDFSELVWSRLPLIAAAVEPWNESRTTLLKWNEKLGWPDAVASDEDEEVKNHGELAVGKRPVLTDRFDQDLRLICNLPHPGGPRPKSEIEFMLDLVVGAQIGSRDGMPLSVDAEWTSVVRSVPDAFVAREQVGRWRQTHEAPISRAHGYMRNHEFNYLVNQYQARSVWMDDPQYKWVFFDIAVLAFSAVDDREDSDSQMRSLVDALEFAPRWVEYALMLALSTRPFYATTRRAQTGQTDEIGSGDPI